MGRQRALTGGGILAILLAGAALAQQPVELLRLKAIDARGAPVAGLVFQIEDGHPAAPPTDADGLTSIRLHEEARSAGWARISLTSSSAASLDTVIVEPWNGFVPVGPRPDVAGIDVTVLVELIPVATEPLDSRLAASVAADILVQEALDRGSTRVEKGERLDLVTHRAATLGVTPEVLEKSLDSLSAETGNSFQAGVGYLWNGDSSAASDRLLEVWKHADAAARFDPAAAVDSAQFLGIAYLLEGEDGRAAYVLARACDLRPRDLDLLTLLGKALHRAGNFTEAESALRRVLDQRQAERGVDHPSLTPTLNNLAILYFEKGRYAEARTLNERALAIDEASGEPDHRMTVALLTNLAAIDTALGDHAAAEPLLLRALEIEEQAHGEAGEELASTLNNLALVYLETGRLIESKNLYERVLTIDRASSGPESTAVASDVNNLAMVSDELGSMLEAEKLYRRALDLRQRILEPNHPDLAQSYGNLAWFYHRQQSFDEAESLYLAALEVLDAGLGADPVYLAWTLKCLGMLYQKQGRYAEAEPLYRRSLEIFETIETSGQPELISLLWTYAALLEETDRAEEAAKLEKRARDVRDSGQR